MHKRFYTVLPRPAAVIAPTASTSQLPRVRSNSASSRSLYTSTHLSFLDGPPPPPPPPSTRGNSNVIVGTRLVAEARGEIEGHSNPPSSQGQQNAHLPYSIALTLGQSEASSHLPLSPYNPFLPHQSLSPLLVYSAKSADAPAAEPRKKRRRTRYQLDVGAYGIPKRSRGQFVAGRDGHGRLAPGGELRPEPHQDELGRAVQVGEDAYFVRDNAMGVADGVGGWARLKKTSNSTEPSPSALFARRLMHYCSEEVDAASEQTESSDVDPYSDAEDDIFAELEDSLEELEDGLDVLMILEKAYEKTLRSHVRPADQSSSRSMSSADGVLASCGTVSTPETAAHAAGAQNAQRADGVAPLFEGSSTALVAILEHPSPRAIESFSDAPLFDGKPTVAKHASGETQEAGGAVIRIAHLGDCMGMLIRGETIVWRTEEMWWNFNTPVQLGPASTTKPRDARVFTVPVEEDDILILASDGLSDNLWDADILDEVVRFRRSFMPSPASSSSPESAAPTATAATAAFRRSTLAGMLSEALCSRAKRVSETRGARKSHSHSKSTQSQGAGKTSGPNGVQVEFEVPFARRAREQGRLFDGGKPDDISVLVAVISPVS